MKWYFNHDHNKNGITHVGKSLQVFHLSHNKPELRALTLPESLQVQEALSRVLRLPAVGSKRYLTNKVRRSHSYFLSS